MDLWTEGWSSLQRRRANRTALRAPASCRARVFFPRLLGVLTLALLLSSGQAFAAVTANSVVTPQTPNRGIVQFLQGTDTAGTYKTLYTAGTNGSKCIAGWENNNDASATHLITIQIVNGGVKYGGVAFNTIANDGFADAKPSRSWLSPAFWQGPALDSDGNTFIYLANGDTLQATFATAITSADLINLGVICADY